MHSPSMSALLHLYHERNCLVRRYALVGASKNLPDDLGQGRFPAGLRDITVSPERQSRFDVGRGDDVAVYEADLGLEIRSRVARVRSAQRREHALYDLRPSFAAIKPPPSTI
jgi:hypothetical protein